MKLMESAARRFESSGYLIEQSMKKSPKTETRFAICIADDLPSLEARKIYRVLPDDKAEAINWIRVVDDSEEDYLYPARDFVFVDLPQQARHLMSARKPFIRKKATTSTSTTKRRKRSA